MISPSRIVLVIAGALAGGSAASLLRDEEWAALWGLLLFLTIAGVAWWVVVNIAKNAERIEDDPAGDTECPACSHRFQVAAATRIAGTGYRVDVDWAKGGDRTEAICPSCITAMVKDEATQKFICPRCKGTIQFV